jgi:drug/metabolite transporter (DMT)-like permease
MVCGVLYAAQGLTVWLSEPPFSLSIPYLDSASDLTWQTLVNVSDVVFLVGALVAVAALAPLYILHGGVNGIAGALVSLVAFAGLALLVMFGLGDVFEWFRSWSSTPLIWGTLLATLGGMFLGTITLVLRALPGWGWCGVALIIGGLSLAPAALGGELFATLAGVAWATVGYAIFRAAVRRTERPSRVR